MVRWKVYVMSTILDPAYDFKGRPSFVEASIAAREFPTRKACRDFAREYIRNLGGKWAIIQRRQGGYPNPWVEVERIEAEA